MSQYDFGNLSSPLNGADFFDNKLEPWRNALHTNHSGTSRPAYAQAGMMWLDTTTNPWAIKWFTGSADIIMGRLNTSLNTFTTANGALNNVTATTNPTVSNDSSQGYAIGSRWVNTTTGKEYMATSVGVGTATWVRIANGTDNLSVFAATTSAQLAGIISDETGSGLLVFNNAPSLTNPDVTTQTQGNNSTKAASTAYVDTAVANGSKVAQVVAVSSSAVDTTSVAIPLDDTEPQSGEGKQLLISPSFTPKNAASTIIVKAFFYGACNTGGGNIVIALFQSSVANAIAAMHNAPFGANAPVSMPIGAQLSAGSTAARTYSLRYGPSNAAHVATANGNNGGRLFGATQKCFLEVLEVLP